MRFVPGAGPVEPVGAVAAHHPRVAELDLREEVAILWRLESALALAQGQTYTCRVDDPEVDSAEAALLRERGFASLLLTPLVAGDRPIGIIELFDTRTRVFTTSDQRVALALAHHLAPLLRLLQKRADAAQGYVR